MHEFAYACLWSWQGLVVLKRTLIDFIIKSVNFSSHRTLKEISFNELEFHKALINAHN